MSALRRTAIGAVTALGLVLAGQLLGTGSASAMTKAELVAVLGDRATEVSAESPVAVPVDSATVGVDLGVAEVSLTGE
ncbi:hypothetical protein [Saccharothrix obliqua]|uniref:hypothetical protein n=1 Tax=Saccharothrix obliqua TaxID=2861747 RepID=UPI001C6006F4|nr:hypothetical protein [Saccharothrix obliqua]MBW4718636.1 hypothetical protein [Saccharothrix obliqua]